ncbi:uncharacterized protein LOC129245437 [Anastrepha obliqua]|uniref:uncharacterized protein LOC129245437 n=1 Tax=Anastrepha obliqua TaxID=95512 RepID=UPI00240A985A|nr:uncharacterized protein LOC129245437 [Anastrepha obliqua]
MQKLTLFLLCLGVATSWAKSPYSLLSKTEMNLLQVMMDTRQLQRSNPTRSMGCFDYYLPLFDSISEKYKEAYAACVDKGNADREAIDAATQPKRDLIENVARSSCLALQECTLHNGSVDYFSCFASTGKENTENMYEISANASATLAEVRESYRLIETEENRCTNTSERAYVEEIYQANLDLQSCLTGDTPVPTTTTTTPTPSPTDDPNTTTASTVTSTDEPLTKSSSVEPTTADPTTTTVASTPTSTEEPLTKSSSVESTTDDPTTTTAASSDTDSSEHNLLPEEDLFAIARKTFVKMRSSVRKH